MKGQVIKKHSNFHYVKVDDNETIYECMLRERLKKEQIDVLVGDFVEIDEMNNDTSQAVISSVFDRNIYISRPQIANMDQNIIIMSVSKPGINLLQLDRFIIHTQLAGLEHVICINKCDLKDKKKILPVLRETYSALNFDVLEISAIEGTGLDQLKDRLKGKSNIFSGPSGVGKSTIINILKPGLNLKVGKIGSKSQKGTHTTRHTELVKVDLDNNSHCLIADTPGFSYLKFDTFLPEDIEKQFIEFEPYRQKCFYSDCIHINEVNCEVKNNIDDISATRYESYNKFISEALIYKEKLYSISTKDEGLTKLVDSSGKNQIHRLKLGYNLVDVSRKTYKQKLSSLTSSDNPEESYDETLD